MKLLVFLFSPAILFATYFGNPALPKLQSDGLFKSPPSWYCLRIGYMTDYLYSQRYRDTYAISSLSNPSSVIKLSTDAATLTLDFKNYFDITALIGSSELQIDQSVFTKRQLSWGIGSKWLLYQTGSLTCALDLKYFESEQKPLYFVSDGYAYNVISNFHLNYAEIQAALGAAYRTKTLAPYFYLTYLYSKIDPTPYSVIVRIPFFDFSADASSRSITGMRRWGLAVGGTVIGGKKGSLTIESRFFNQNAINVSGEVRF